MKNKIWIVVLLLALCVYLPSMAFAETVVLKSGQIVEGKIIEKTDKYIKVDFEGVVLTYFLDEISHMDKEKKDDSVFSENNLNNQDEQTKESSAPTVTLDEQTKESSAPTVTLDEQTEESNSPTVILEDGPAGIQQINQAYYNLNRHGFQEFKCEIASSTFEPVKDMLKLEYPATDPKRDVLDSVRFYLTFNREGKLNLDYASLTQTGKVEIDDAIKKYTEFLKNTLEVFFTNWSRYVIELYLIDPEQNSTIEKMPNGYVISYKDTASGLSAKVQIDNKLHLSEWVVNQDNNISKTTTHFINSQQGLLIQSFDEDHNNGATKFSTKISYQEVDGFQMPKQVSIKNNSSEKQRIVEIKFFDYKIEKIP